jgi:hypothetical protein
MSDPCCYCADGTPTSCAGCGREYLMVPVGGRAEPGEGERRMERRLAWIKQLLENGEYVPRDEIAWLVAEVAQWVGRLTDEVLAYAIEADRASPLCQRCDDLGPYDRSPESCPYCAAIRVEAVMRAALREAPPAQTPELGGNGNCSMTPGEAARYDAAALAALRGERLTRETPYGPGPTYRINLDYVPGDKPPVRRITEHVCGLQGYCPGPPHFDPPCPACVRRVPDAQPEDACEQCKECGCDKCNGTGFASGGGPQTGGER